MKMIAKESIAIGIRPIKPAVENLSAPGVRSKVA
jgi:hypothetical protein